ncbi:hypothetical protein E2L07_03610 [Halalkalibacterium halodurans]|uniref:ATP-binding protein n=1 Tax=Halalkalibacterium halodurans TaxID=86665 RepID=UPI001067706D|nr:hypothetical protein [Halalkalibacterium halodurans]TES56751.1 hypothetical protein E2L07_03610 [Halalkalibacterium halodurans]
MSFFSFLKKNQRQQENKPKGESKFLKQEAEFVEEQKRKGIGIKSALIEYAAISRGLKVDRLSSRLLIIESKEGNQFGFHNMNGNDSSRIGMNLCDRKHDSRHILKKKGISVVDSEVFGIEHYDEAVEFAQKLGFPVVVKPTSLARGKGITTNIHTLEEFKKAWDKGCEAYRRKKSTNRLLVERHVSGDDYRFFVVGNKVISATHRKRANVTGDGTSTVLELIKQKNLLRAKNPYLSDYLIPEDPEQLDLLEKQKISLEDVPEKGREVTLRSQSNLSAGGDSIDVTETAHPDYHELAVRVIQSIPGIEYGGIDFIANDITKKPTTSNHIVSEVEFSPAPLSHFPFIGKGRDMAGAIIEHYLSKEKN